MTTSSRLFVARMAVIGVQFCSMPLLWGTAAGAAVGFTAGVLGVVLWVAQCRAIKMERLPAKDDDFLLEAWRELDREFPTTPPIAPPESPCPVPVLSAPRSVGEPWWRAYEARHGRYSVNRDQFEDGTDGYLVLDREYVSRRRRFCL